MYTVDAEIVIDNKKIGSKHPVYFIADIAANHDGDIGRAKELIYLYVIITIIIVIIFIKFFKKIPI